MDQLRRIRNFCGLRLVDVEGGTGILAARISLVERGLAELSVSERVALENFLRARLRSELEHLGLSAEPRLGVLADSISVYLNSGLVAILLLLKTSPCQCCLFLLARVSIEGKQTVCYPGGRVFSGPNLATGRKLICMPPRSMQQDEMV